jgi:ABC-type cobalamin/Fe3+-siderophores transport system ATPase subunit
VLQTITLRAGPTPATSPQAITLTPVTVFVGPNNSGKSRLLKELEQFCASGQVNPATLLLAKAWLAPFTEAEANSFAMAASAGQPYNAATADTLILKGRQGNMVVQRADLTAALMSPTSHG